MRIGVVSDTHASVAHTRPAVRMLQELEVDELLHCGDVGSGEVVALLAEWPGRYVLGNCDHDAAALGLAIESLGQTFCGEFGDFEIAGARVALLHSHDAARFDAVVASGEYDLVCYGHTHVAKIERRGRTVVLNPGALYRANPHSVALVEIGGGRASPKVEATIVPL